MDREVRDIGMAFYAAAGQLYGCEVSSTGFR